VSDLLKINVNEHVEKKNGLSYLSWAWAWAEVLKIDPKATWAPKFFGPEASQQPAMFMPDGSAMVAVHVTIKGDTKGCMLPVMNHRNQAIKNPDAFAVNTALMRCLAKAIAMHGLGLYIYAGEDLPEGDGEKKPEDDRTLIMKIRANIAEHFANDLDMGALQEWELAADMGEEMAKQVWAGLTTPHRDRLRELRGKKEAK